uniref:Uncharacterized protein n=1 Tax=Zea mays TaxID=4577 RepID=C4J5G1_MAIZE|nr:unknown [Zea mays]
MVARFGDAGAGVEAAVRHHLEPPHRLVRARRRRPRAGRQRERHAGGAARRGGRPHLPRGVVAHQAVPAQGGPERDARRPRADGAVGARRGARVHGPARRPGAGVLGPRVHGELLPRVHGRDPAAVPDGAAVRRRGAAAGDGPPGVVGGQVRAGVQEHLQLRAGGPGPRPARALLPPRPGGAHQPRRLQHRPAPRPQRLLHAGLHRVHARRLRAPARRRRRRRWPVVEAAAEAAADRARADAAVRERGGDRARRGEARVRGGGVGGDARGGALRGAGQQLRRHHGRARRRADQHGVRADGRGGHPGGAAGRAGVRGGLLPGSVQGHGAALPRVPDHAGGEHPDQPVPARPPHLHGPQRDQEQGLGVPQGCLPRQAGRVVGHEEVPAHAQEGHRAHQEGQGQGQRRRRRQQLGIAVHVLIHPPLTLLLFFLPSFSDYGSTCM